MNVLMEDVSLGVVALTITSINLSLESYRPVFTRNSAIAVRIIGKLFNGIQ